MRICVGDAVIISLLFCGLILLGHIKSRSKTQLFLVLPPSFSVLISSFPMTYDSKEMRGAISTDR
jgi:hypothetical protein